MSLGDKDAVPPRNFKHRHARCAMAVLDQRSGPYEALAEAASSAGYSYA